MKVGMQLYSLSPLIDEGRMEEAVKKACASGIDGLELYSRYEIPAMTYRRIMNDAGVICSGTHNYWAPLRDDLDSVMEYNYVLDNENIICHWLNEDERGSVENYLRVAESLNEIAVKLRKNGFNLLYHNHDFEFKEVFGDKCGYDLITENTDPALVGLELHIGQLPQFGLDIPEFIKRFGGRIKILHAHAFDGNGPFDSRPGVLTAKSLGTEWTVLENVYPADVEVSRVRADVDDMRAMTRE